MTVNGTLMNYIFKKYIFTENSLFENNLFNTAYLKKQQSKYIFKNKNNI